MSQPYNPYQAPGADVDAAADAIPADQLVDAGAGARLANVLIDFVGRFVLMTIVVTVLALLGITLPEGRLFEALYGLISMFIYYLVFEGTSGRSLGKLVTGTRVVTESGGRPTLSQICGRTLSRLVPFEPFSFLGASPTGWHDRWSGTRVVRVRR
jgi:uncharacterized RDD family membrane protein YckC